MLSYKDLLTKRAALDVQIAEARRLEIADAVAKAKTIIANFSLQEKDIFGRHSSRSGQTVPAKYRDRETGKTWSGRGRTPRWLDGKDRNDYLIR